MDVSDNHIVGIPSLVSRGRMSTDVMYFEHIGICVMNNADAVANHAMGSIKSYSPPSVWSAEAL
jgi:hypothetical protein